MCQSEADAPSLWQVHPGSGDRYHHERHGIEFVKDYDKVNDMILSKQGVSFVFDKATAKRLQGATIDFVNNETQAGFLFSNPNDS